MRIRLSMFECDVWNKGEARERIGRGWLRERANHDPPAIHPYTRAYLLKEGSWGEYKGFHYTVER